jgi:hypothetical protein
MTTRDPDPRVFRDPADALGRLERDLTALSGRMTPDARTEALDRYDALAAEVRSDSPFPDLAHDAGDGLIGMVSDWPELAPDIAAAVGDLLADVDRRASRATEWAAAPEAAAVPMEPDPADEEAALPGGPEGIGGPILPDD